MIHAIKRSLPAYAAAGVLAFGLSTLAGHAYASHNSTFNGDLEQVVTYADLIFQGEVVNVQSRMSEFGDRYMELPHVFVTYRIERILKGGIAGKGRKSSITLRFLGGPIDDKRGMMIAGQPMFRAGNRDILMVKRNGEVICPLIDCAGGRFRIYEGLALTNGGREIRIPEPYRIAAGARVAPASLLTQLSDIGPVIGMGAEPETATDDGHDDDHTHGPNDPSGDQETVPPMQHADFVALIEQLVDPSDDLEAVASLDPDRAFYIPYPEPVQPTVDDTAPEADPNDSDPDEVERVRRNGGDPVLPATR